MLVATCITTIISSIHSGGSVYANTGDNDTQQNGTNDNGWRLVWEDNFDGDSLNLQHWNYETHEPGWVNNKLQEYTNDQNNKQNI